MVTKTVFLYGILICYNQVWGAASTAVNKCKPQNKWNKNTYGGHAAMKWPQCNMVFFSVPINNVSFINKGFSFRLEKDSVF